MSDPDVNDATTGPILVSEAYSAARELLRHAEEDAARIRAEADRYMRQREQEAELLVGKARRLLALAEERASTPPPVVIDLDAPAPAQSWDLDAPVLARVSVDAIDDDAPVSPGSLRTRSDLDSILATAVSNAIHRALPAEG